MECPSCFDLYDDEIRIPRNLFCGHTYCEYCLNQLLLINKKIECPICRDKLDPLLKPSQLSKNYIAADLASKQREIQKKLLFCTDHKEPLRLYCESCQQQICANCIIDHNGHRFLKQEHSVPLLKERAETLQSKLLNKLEELKKVKTRNDEFKIKVQNIRDENIKLIDEEFDRLIYKLNERRQTLKYNYMKICAEAAEQVEKDIAKQYNKLNVIKSLEKASDQLKKLIDSLNKTKVIQGDEVIKPLNDLEDEVNSDIKSVVGTKPIQYSIPLIMFDRSCYSKITNIGITSKDYKNPRICFFGEKNKVLQYNIEKGEWKLSFLPMHGQAGEFNYYSSACTIPSGDILITGGGVSHSVYLFSLSKMTLTSKKHLIYCRKEHASVFLNNYVYVLGGYDGKQSTFLSSCEQYDLEKDEWKMISPMLIAKCAFGATTVNNRYIFTVGGYDGQERLNTIEKYDYKLDKWTLIDVKLKHALSNSACISYSENTLAVLGGGFNLGFSFDFNLLDIQKNEWLKLPNMSDGRDLRNKIVHFNGYIYAIGGNNYKGEKYSVAKNEWASIISYEYLVKDNLDSWSCALAYDLSTKPNDYQGHHIYQNYQFDEMYDVDDDEDEDGINNNPIDDNFSDHMSIEQGSYLNDEW